MFEFTINNTIALNLRYRTECNLDKKFHNGIYSRFVIGVEI